MITALVIAQNYPDLDGGISLQYIHSRNKVYVNNGIQVSVVSFCAKKDYVIDGINVYTYKTFRKEISSRRFDVLISHAPNLKRHFPFLLRYQRRFKNIFFFFHGHEILIRSREYPKPYSYKKGMPQIVNDIYDIIKLGVWRWYFRIIAPKAQFIFVSRYLYGKFLDYVGIDEKIIENKKHIIHNCVGEVFERASYKVEYPKKYDFITIRGNIDTSTCAIDIVNQIAEKNSKYRFCIVGKGRFYLFYDKPDNVDWIAENLKHEDIIKLLNSSYCALMPTRQDTQGVMACEMATYGMPLITSDIDICHEIFEGFENVRFIDNDEKEIDIEPLFEELRKRFSLKKVNYYFQSNTVMREIMLFRKYVNHE